MAWTNVLDSGLSSSAFSKCFLGTLGDDLYLFGSATESAGAMAGVWRSRGGEWTRLTALTTQDFNGLLPHGAVELKGKLYVGDRHAGKLYRLDLDEGGEFRALTVATTIGFEDVFLGPVVDGKLWAGTFGNASTPDNPGVYTYDGATATEVKEFAHLGTSGEVTSLTYWDGLIWVTANNSAVTTNEIWSIDPRSGVAHLRQSLGTTQVALCLWQGGLYGIKAIPSSTQKFVVWDGSQLADLSGDISAVASGAALAWRAVGAGDRLLAAHYYDGLFSYKDGAITQEATGASAATFGGATSFKRHHTSLYLTTSQPVKLWSSRERVGFDFTLNPGTSSEFSLSSGDGFVVRPPAEFPLPSPKPAYASSYETEGSISSDEAHYENREIALPLEAQAASAAALEASLTKLSRTVGQINREGGSLRVITPNETVCYFTFEREVSVSAPIDVMYEVAHTALLDFRAAARPFWRGTKRKVGIAAETNLPALVATFPQPQDYYGRSLALSPVVYLRLGEASGTTAADSSGRGHPGTYVNTPTLGVTGALVGDPDKATTFTLAQLEYVSVADHADLDVGDRFSAVAWVKRTSDADFHTIFSKGDNSFEITIGTSFQNNRVTLSKQNVAAIVSSTAGVAADAAFHHVAVTKDGSDVHIYLDGTDVTGTVTNATLADTAQDLNIGRRVQLNDQHMNGAIDEPALYPYALPPSAVFGLYSAGVAQPAGGPVVAGDVAAEAELVVKDESGVDRWAVIVGGDSRWYDSAPTARLFYQAEDLTPTGTSTKTTGAAGASGAGSNVVRNTDLTPTYQAILRSEVDASNLALTHKGTYRVWARLYRPPGNTGAVSVRLEWAEGDYTRVTLNDPVSYGADDREGVFTWANLGLVSIDPTSTRWEFRLLAKSTVAGDEIDADCFVPFPTEVVYTELSGKLQFQNPTAFSALSTFDTEAGVITGDSATVGGVWVGAGDADDFSVAAGVATRTAVSDTSETGRAITLNLNMTATAVQVDAKSSSTDGNASNHNVLARWAAATTYVRAGWQQTGTGYMLVQLYARNAGATVVLKEVLGARYLANTYYTTRLVIDGGGRYWLWVFPQGGSPGTPIIAGQDAALATGGALANGDPGIYDERNAATADTRTYDNFMAFVPTVDAALFANQTLALRHDSAKREPSGGGDLTTISDRRGRYLKIPPSGPEGRSTRLAVLALPNDPYTAGDAAASYDLSAQLYVTPRGLLVPEA